MDFSRERSGVKWDGWVVREHRRQTNNKTKENGCL